MCESKDKIDLIYKTMCELEEMHKKYTEQHALSEKMVCDLYHFIEFDRFNVVQGYYKAKQLQGALQQRREAKQELEVLGIAINAIEKLKPTFQGYRDKARNTVKSQEARGYNPRVLKNIG